MKVFLVNNKEILFGSNALENTDLVNSYKFTHPNATWFHLSNSRSSHAFCLQSEELNRSEKNIVGNILLALSKNTSKNQKMSFCKIKNVKSTNTPGLVNIKFFKEITIKKINEFDKNLYLQNNT
jgi:hypothetical protein